MKIVVSKTELLKKLKVLSKMPRGSKLGSKLSEQIFFEVKDEIVKMMVYDGREIFSIIELKTLSIDEGEECLFNVDLKLILSIVSKLGNEIEIELGDKYVHVKSEKTHFELYRKRFEQMWENQDRPRVEDIIVDFEMESARLKSMFESVYVSASDDKANQALNSIKLRVDNCSMELSATDGYRASVVSVEIEESVVADESNKLLSGDAVPIIIEVLNMGPVATVSVGEKSISIKVEDVVVVVRGRGDKNYPNISKLLMNEGERVIAVDKKELVSAMDGISNLGANLIKVDNQFSDGRLTLAGESDINKSYVVSGEIDIRMSGDIEEKVDMLFRSKLLLEGVKSVNSSRVEIRLKGENDFITIRPKQGDQFVHIVLPCRKI